MNKQSRVALQKRFISQVLLFCQNLLLLFSMDPSEDFENEQLDNSARVLLGSHQEGVFDLEDGETVKIYSYEVRRLPDWFKNIEELPDGYFFSGGVARGVLLEQLGDISPKPRDLDVVAIDEFKPDSTLVDQISQKFMHEDYAHGHGVKIDPDLQAYFSSRDFTLNEVLFARNKIHYTNRALRDLKEKNIRPTEHESRKWRSYEFDRYGVSPKLAVKALILQAEFFELYGQGGISGIEEWQWNLDGIPPFYLALGLEKAHQKKIAIPFYVQVLDKSNIVDENLPPGRSLDNVKRLAYFVRRKMLLEGQNVFDFSDEELNFDPEMELVLQEAWEKYYDKANQYVKPIKGLSPRERNPQY